ncbi:hypothetical protein JAAARDRAFT_28213 [Jaapia argillacea MUCL 33604]|uniref:Vacuolar import/degradation Vid27 C-terminal domain-containing protein n=1 Tax=Jaapia argillacea MUCL 33604 TaxID=933084 RepID=A0A067QC97_9AGAM|nr:hypothetical protein JAAARDRAFT_28213 [Jaapia argillacea MUCL 33604]
MNIFRSLLGKVWQDTNAAEVVKISTGELFLVRPGNIRSSRECIYPDAMATIRRVPSLEHNFQLVIARVYEDGDQELLDDTDENEPEKTFLISEELEFRTGEMEGEPTLVWRDLDGDVDEVYEFKATGTNEPTRAFFETCMYQAMFERKYRRGGDTATDAELQEFIWHPPVKKGKGKATSRSKAKSKDETSLNDPMQSLSVKEPAPQRQPTSPPRKAPVSPPKPPVQPKKAAAASVFPVIAEAEAQLYLWDLQEEGFMKQADVVARIVHRPNAGFEYLLTASNEDGQLLMHKITSDMNQRWSHKMQSLTWNYLSENRQSSWCVRIEDAEAFEGFGNAFTRVLWETLHQYPWDKMKADEQAYVTSSNTEDVEMEDGEEDSEDEEDQVEDVLEDKSEDGSEEDEPQPDEDDLPQPLTKGERNSQLMVGYKGDRSYVVRGNKIGVFSYSGENQVKYNATISNLATPKGKEFKPKKVMLHDQDTKMVVMNPAEPNSLFSMDIERGKIVEEWKVHDSITVDHIAPDTKFAQTTREQTLVGASHNALFRIDPRVSGNKMVDSQLKQYVSKNKFSDVATTASGQLAVASEKGDIRLFDSIGKNAKTALPPLGDPILGVDVTANGRYLIATTKTYLLLIDTLIGEGRYTGSLGFDRSFPASAKPIPKRLQLRSEHVVYMGNEVSFTPARFNAGEGQEESAIVTSTGQYVIMWDFKKVKKGQLDKYEIKKYEDLVVQDNFKFGDDKEIIIALQNNVLAVNKRNLLKPSRVSLAPGGHSSRSRSGIVNTPY